MGYDTFGLFRGWCRVAPSCLEYVPVGLPEDAGDFRSIRCAKCGCQPQQHQPCEESGYDPHSPEQMKERMLFDDRLMPPAERAAKHKALGDAAFKKGNYRTAYTEYSTALDATPDNHTILSNRCQTYLKVGKDDLALVDAEQIVRLTPTWSKGHYRHGSCLMRLERYDDAVQAFSEAVRLEPTNSECAKQLDAAKAALAARRKLDDDLAKARKKSTIRQAYNQKCEAEFQARLHAKESGRIKDMGGWDASLKQEFEQEYMANIKPPAGVEFLLPAPKEYEDGPRIEDITDEPEDGVPADDGVLLLEDNGDADDEEENEDGPRIEDNPDDDGDDDGPRIEANSDDDEDDDDGPRIEENPDEDSDEGPTMEENKDEIGGGGATAAPKISGPLLEANDDDDDDDESYVPDDPSEEDSGTDYEAEQEAYQLDDSKFVPEGTQLALPPRNYILVTEDGKLHKKDNFEPMSFGMQRVHYETEPEPIWVQTKNARWLQSATEITVIPYTVPRELCNSAGLKVSFGARQLHVMGRQSHEIFCEGELENRIDPVQSTWTTDGKVVHITLVKQNLLLYDKNAKGAAADTHWHRLFTSDQFTERGMIDANYSDLPEHMLRANKMAELKRKAKEQEEKEANLCPICGKDVRFFCDCRVNDRDYERPLPDGWKKSELGFTDTYDAYDIGKASQLKPRPPSPPRPYQGGLHKYSVNGSGTTPEAQKVPNRLPIQEIP